MEGFLLIPALGITGFAMLIPAILVILAVLVGVLYILIFVLCRQTDKAYDEVSEVLGKGWDKYL